jgi:hypothetical protein
VIGKENVGESGRDFFPSMNGHPYPAQEAGNPDAEAGKMIDQGTVSRQQGPEYAERSQEENVQSDEKIHQGRSNHDLVPCMIVMCEFKIQKPEKGPVRRFLNADDRKFGGRRELQEGSGLALGGSQSGPVMRRGFVKSGNFCIIMDSIVFFIEVRFGI